jgi:hypothetical protein
MFRQCGIFYFSFNSKHDDTPRSIEIRFVLQARGCPLVIRDEYDIQLDCTRHEDKTVLHALCMENTTIHACKR